MSAGPGAARVLWTPHPVALVGRHRLADVPLDHESVSARHALLHVIDGRVFWVDLGSRTGVVRGGEAVAAGWLLEGEAVGIGPYRLGVMVRPAPAATDEGLDDPLLRWHRGREPEPAVCLEISNPADRAVAWWMDRTLVVVGQDPPSKLRLHDPSVSRVHGCLLHTPAGVWVTDLFGRDGVRVNGVPVRHALLRDGDVLGIGVFDARVSHRARPPRLAPPGRSSRSGGALRALPAPGAPGPVPDSAAGDFPIPARPSGRRGLVPARDESSDEAFRLLDLVLGAGGVDRIEEIRWELSRIRTLLEEGHELRPTAPGPEPAAPTVLGGARGRPASGPARELEPESEPGPATPAAPAPAPAINLVMPPDFAGTSSPSRDFAPSLASSLDSPTARALHAQLRQRVAALQAERRGFWGRTLGRLGGR